MDMRYLKKPRVHHHAADQTRGDVVSYLAALYNSCAETLPDVRDDPLTAEEEVTLQPAAADPYASGLGNAAGGQLPARRKKERKHWKGVKIHSERSAEEQRYLPPGTMKDHWEQYRLTSTLDCPASFPTFWRAPGPV